ncbi:4837_t:CDS:2, partial [Acaulospora colombiana]
STSTRDRSDSRQVWDKDGDVVDRSMTSMGNIVLIYAFVLILVSFGVDFGVVQWLQQYGVRQQDKNGSYLRLNSCIVLGAQSSLCSSGFASLNGTKPTSRVSAV